MKAIIAACAVATLIYGALSQGPTDPCTAENPNAELWGPFCYSHAPTLHEWSGKVYPHCTEAREMEPCFDYAIYDPVTKTWGGG